MTVAELIEKLQTLPQDAYVIRPGQINGDWAMTEVEPEEFEFGYAQHLECYGEFLPHAKQYVTSVPVVRVLER
jgi:hypothetical protein